MALKISPRSKLDSVFVGTNCSQTLDISKKLKTDTVASYSYKIYDSSDNEVTDTFGGGSSISSNIITFGIKAIEAGDYTIEFIITCNEVLSDGITPREFYMTMTIQIIDTALVKPEEEESAFVFTIQTAGDVETFSLPLEALGTYDFTVDWGDSNSDDITAYDQAEVTHTYASAGTHEIFITGIIVGWRFAGAGSYLKIYEIKSWGPLRLGNSNSYFYGCSNLIVTATDVLDLTGTTDLESMFDGCSSLTTVPSMNSWDVSSVTNIAYLFYDAIVFNQDIGSWNVVAVTNMSYLFYGAALFNQDIGSWDLSSVIDVSSMFEQASAFNQDISLWDLSSATTVNAMFNGASAFNQNIGNWDVSSVANMATMLTNASAFNQDLSSWDITLVTTMWNMLIGVTLSTANYDALLIGWESQAVQNNVSFHGGNSKYSVGAAATARQALIDGHNWNIQDGGQE